MFNLIAKTMFEATRMAAPETTQPRNRWSFKGDRNPAASCSKGASTGKADIAPSR